MACREALEGLARSHPMILYGRNTHVGALVEVALRRMRVMTSVRYESDDTHTLMSFIRDGHAWGVVSALCLVQGLYLTDGVSLIELDRSRHARTIWLLARKGELGIIPQQVSDAIQEILYGPVLDSVTAAAPWLRREAFEASGDYYGG